MRVTLLESEALRHFDEFNEVYIASSILITVFISKELSAPTAVKISLFSCDSSCTSVRDRS